MAEATLKVNADISGLMSQLEEIKRKLEAMQTQGKQVTDAIDNGFKGATDSAKNYEDNINRLTRELKEQKQIIADMRATEQQLKVARRQSNDPNEIARYDRELKRLAQDIAVARREQVEMTRQINQQKEALKQNNEELKKAAAAAKEKSAATTGMVTSFKQLADALGVTFTLAAFVSLLKKGIEIAYEAEKANKQLAFTTEKVGLSYDNLIEFSKELEDKFAIDDEVFKQQAAFLALQGRTEEQIKKIIITAANYAAVVGKDIPTAVRELDATFEGNIGRLGKIDNELKKLTKTQLENGAAIDILSEKYDGFAERSVTAADRVKVAWDNMLESIGNVFVDAIDNVLQVWGDVDREAIINREIKEEQLREDKKFLDGLAANYIKFKKEKRRSDKEIDNYTRILYAKAKGYINEFSMTYEEFVRMLKLASGEIKNKTNNDESQLTKYEKLNKELQDLNNKYRDQILLNDPLAYATAQRIKNIEKEIERVKILSEALKNFDFNEEVIIEPDILVKPKDLKIEVSKDDELGDFAKELEAKMEKDIKEIWGNAVPEPEEIFTPDWQARFILFINKFFGKTLFSSREEFKDFSKALNDIFNLGLDEISSFISISITRWNNVIDSIQDEISETEKRLKEEQKKQEEGLANNVRLEQQKLNFLKQKQKEAEEEQRAALERQRAIEAITQSINLATAISGILKQIGVTGPAGLIIAPALIATLLTLFKVSKQKAAEAAKFEEGGVGILGGRRHYEGGTYINGIGEAEKGELFAIVNRKQTLKFQSGIIPLIEGINRNDNSKLIKGLNEIALKANIEAMRGDRNINIKNTVSLNEVQDIKRIRELIENSTSVSFVDGWRIEKRGNITKRIKLN